jgi:virginiamycin B lyase
VFKLRYFGYLILGPILLVAVGACSPFSSIREYPTSQGAKPVTIVCGALSGNVWYTEPDIGRIAERLASGKVIEYRLAKTTSDPTFLALDFGEEFIWFTEPRANAVGRIGSDGHVVEFALPTSNSEPFGIAVDYNGGAWFVERATNQIGHISNSGIIKQFPIPTPHSQPVAITESTPQSQEAWFTEYKSNKIGKVDQSGRIVEYRIPTAGSGPTKIVDETWHGDQESWFVESDAGRLGTITSAGAISETYVGGKTGALDTGFPPAIWFADSTSQVIGYTHELALGGRYHVNISAPIGDISYCVGRNTIWATEPSVNMIAEVKIWYPNF